MLFLLGSIIGAFAYYIGQAIKNSNEIISFENPAPVSGLDLLRTPQPLAVGKYKIIYPYSVIPGGVPGREGLAASIRNDKAIGAHYADFQVNQARIVKAKETKFVHVSYRIQNQIFWTAKTIKVPRGEALISDGRNMARTRCGNRVSSEPQQPISNEEPAIESFDIQLEGLDIPELLTLEFGLQVQPIPPLESPIPVPLPRDLPFTKLEIPELLTLESGPQVRPIPPLESYIPIPRPNDRPYYFRPLSINRSNNVAISEPGTLGLLALGLSAVTILKFFWRK
jgi:hypothetical protein